MTSTHFKLIFIAPFLLVIFLFSNSTIANSSSLKVSNSKLINESESGSMIFKFDGLPSIMQIALDTRVQMDITGNINRVIVEQSFTNPSNDWAEGVYVFPLPEDSAVNQLRMYVDDRVIEGQIHKKEEAKKIYTKAKNEGKSASLVEQQRPNIFTTSVANIAPGGTITVAIEYLQSVQIDNNTYSIRFPMVVGDRYIPGMPIKTSNNAMGVSLDTHEVDDASKITPPSESIISALTGRKFTTYLPVQIEINLRSGFELESLESSYHKINKIQIDNQTQHILLVEGYEADRDFELTWSPIQTDEPEISLFAQKNDEDVYLLLMATPPSKEVFKKNKRSRELIFVIDSSGSMSGSSMNNAKTALNKAIKRLDSKDRFNIIDFDSNFTPLFDSAMPAIGMNKHAASKFIRRLDADGGTEMLNPISYALSSEDSNSENFLRQIVFITDGQAGNEKAILSKVEYEIGDNRFFTVGIGSAPNSYLLKKLADFGRGAFTFIGSSQEINQKMNDLFIKLESPALTDITVNFPPGINAELASDLIYDLYAGETITAVFKMNAIPNSLEITGKTINSDYIKNISINPSENTLGIDTLWARSKIEYLTDIHNNAYTTRTRNLSRRDITSLALEYHLVSSFTSLVAVDITPVRPESEQLINQAIIKKAKAVGMENEIRIDSDGNLQNRDDLLQEFIAQLSTQKSSAARSYSANQSAYEAPVAYESAVLMSELLEELKIAEFEAELRAEMALNSSSPVKLAKASQTATYSELLMYIGLIITFLAFISRRKLSI